MIIYLRKFGAILTSRESGREAFAAYQPTLRELKPDELIEVDFDGVEVFTPSWADEFLTPLQERFGTRVTLRPSANPSVRETLALLQEVREKHGKDL